MNKWLRRALIVVADDGIENPSNGTVTTRDDGLLEFHVGFEQE